MVIFRVEVGVNLIEQGIRIKFWEGNNEALSGRAGELDQPG